MQPYLEASLSFMESKEMRDHLRQKLPGFRWAAVRVLYLVFEQCLGTVVF